MKAARIREYNKSLVLEDVPVPDVQPDEVLVQVRACGMCRSDVQLLEGYFRKYNAIPTPIIPGHEITGVIHKRGGGVSQAAGLEEGDHVVVAPPADHHLVALFEPGRFGHHASGLVDHTRDFVSERDRQWHVDVRAEVAIHQLHVGAAHAGGGHFDEHLVGSDRRDGHVLQDQRLVVGVHSSGSHDGPPVWRQALAEMVAGAAADRRRYGPVVSYFLFAKAVADYRQGQFDEAVALLRGETSRVLGPAPRLLLAMARYQAGDRAGARQKLAEAVGSFDWRPMEARVQEAWLAHALRREGEAVVLPDLPAFLAGLYQPKENAERLALLGHCRFTNRALHAARL